MQYFYAIVHKDYGQADSAFGVTFPDLPGCFSAADNQTDLVANAAEALDLWFDDADHVAPRSLEEIRAEAASDLEAGAFIIAVPRIANDRRPVRANISLERGVLEAIDQAAGERKLTRSAFIAQAARNEIEGRA